MKLDIVTLLRTADGFDLVSETMNKGADEIERLRAALLDAAEEVGFWGSYAGDYFKEKHDLDGCIAEIKAAALGEKEQ